MLLKFSMYQIIHTAYGICVCVCVWLHTFGTVFGPSNYCTGEVSVVRNSFGSGLSLPSIVEESVTDPKSPIWLCD